MSDESGDQTEAELERTRQVVREATLAQVEANTAAATEGVTPSADAEGDDEEDLSKLYKADLVERAEAAGIDTEGLTKAELVEALEARSDTESEG